MADKTVNPILHQKRLELQRQEQLLALRRQELRVMELEDDITKTKESMENTKRIIESLESELTACGVKF